jgi:hypothetical protein
MVGERFQWLVRAPLGSLPVRLRKQIEARRPSERRSNTEVPPGRQGAHRPGEARQPSVLAAPSQRLLHLGHAPVAQWKSSGFLNRVRRINSCRGHSWPAVTGLKLQLTPDPRAQCVLIDPAGHVGTVQLRGKLARRVAGLRIVLAGHRVRAITVTSKRFRTAFAIRLGSTEADLQRAYPQLLKAAKKLGKKTTRPYRVKHATFTVRRGRVVAIKLS